MDYTEEVKKTLDYVESHLLEEISLDELANHIGISKFHLERLFKKQLNMGIYKYIQKRRISNASLLLLSSELKIIEIAIISGYSSQEAFSRTFKLYYHLPPAQFRQQFKQLFRRKNTMDELKIKGWLISGSNFEKYEVKLDKKQFHSGMKSVRLSRSENLYTEDFVTVMQQISAKKYLNKRVRISAYLKSKDIDGWGGIWFRIDGSEFKQLKFDNMQNRPIVGTNEWNYYSSVLDVTEEAEVLNFGFLLQGGGQLWADDFSIEIVSKSVPTTDVESIEAYPEEPQNLSFSE